MNKDNSLQQSILIAAIFTLLIWWIKVCETLFGWNFYQLGVYPRNPSGLIGVLAGPLIHGSWQHLISNTLPVLLLGSILVYGYPKSRWWTLAIVWLLSGLGVWLFARESFHYGASGLSHGMFFFLFVAGLMRRDKRSTVLLMVAFFMYGGMLLTIFPGEPGISYEYHMFGGIAGTLCAIVFRRWDPKPVLKIYSWERKTADDGLVEEDDDPIIGDQWKLPEQRARDNSENREP